MASCAYSTRTRSSSIARWMGSSRIVRSPLSTSVGESGAIGLPGSLPVSYHLIHIGEGTRKNHTKVTFQRGQGSSQTCFAAPPDGAAALLAPSFDGGFHGRCTEPRVRPQPRQCDPARSVAPPHPVVRRRNGVDGRPGETGAAHLP